MTNIAALEQRLGVLEAEAAVRRVMARYMQLCDTPSRGATLTDLAELFADDAVWAGRGTRYQAEFGEQIGKDAIVTMFKKMLEPQPHYQFNAHYLTSEAITVDGSAATGSWMLLQAATSTEGGNELRSAKLRIAFGSADGEWKITRFETTALFRRGVD